jgi:hypothetical protein
VGGPLDIGKRICERANMRRMFAVLLFLICASAARVALADSTSASAQPRDTPLLSDRMGISGGAYFTKLKTDFQAGGAHSLGTVIDLETDLDLSSQTNSGWGDVFYRINPRHTLDLTFTAIKRTGHRVVDRDIVYDDLEFFTNTDVQSTFNSRLLGLGYRYSFLNDGRVETGITTGVSTFWYNLELDGQASVAGSGSGTSQIRHTSQDILAPIPSVGIFTSCALRRELVLYGAMNVFMVDVGSVSGHLIDGRFTIHYFPLRHVGIGLGFAGTGVGLKYGTETNTFGADYSYAGWLATLDLTH